MRLRLFWLVLLLGLLLPAQSSAQDAGGRVQTEIDRTGQRIERARTIVSAASNPTAQAELDHAIDLQAGAPSALGQDKLRIDKKLENVRERVAEIKNILRELAPAPAGDAKAAA